MCESKDPNFDTAHIRAMQDVTVQGKARREKNHNTCEALRSGEWQLGEEVRGRNEILQPREKAKSTVQG